MKGKAFEITANSDAALVSLFLSFASADGELHPKEMEVIRQVCNETGNRPRCSFQSSSRV